jgi:hypothetical protein
MSENEGCNSVGANPGQRSRSALDAGYMDAPRPWPVRCSATRRYRRLNSQYRGALQVRSHSRSAILLDRTPRKAFDIDGFNDYPGVDYQDIIYLFDDALQSVRSAHALSSSGRGEL